jgi:hypothetical protein
VGRGDGRLHPAAVDPLTDTATTPQGKTSMASRPTGAGDIADDGDPAGGDSAADPGELDAAGDGGPVPERARDAPPATLVEAIRWDVIVLLVAVIALLGNIVVPDELSPALTGFLALAVLWVGYRIVVKVRAFRSRGQ